MKAPQITFFGMIYSAAGINPDPSRVKDITNLPTPSSKKEIQSFLGLVQYLSPFVPNLSTDTAPLRDLLKKESQFVWSATHQEAFQRIKDKIANTSILQYFNPRLQTKIQVDASQHGLGAALIQIDPKEPDVERVIAFASKSPSETESRYANIERECLAVVFGVERFHTYVYGASIVVESDHEPLENIQQQNLANAPPRLQRMLLRLQPYNMRIKYRKGSDLALADFLSRYSPQQDKTIELEQTIHSVSWSTPKLETLRKETTADPTLKQLSQIMKTGWPERCDQLPSPLHHFWSFKDYIGLKDGILTKGNRIIIPDSLQKDIVNQLHRHCHQGTEKTRLLARQSVYWKNMNADIEEEVSGCMTCRTYAKSQTPEPMVERMLPDGPWQMLATDLFELNGRCYLLVCDYFSKFTIIRSLAAQTSSAVIQRLRTIFSEYGIPRMVFSDNGPCYSSQEFQRFAEKYLFTHVTSSPHFARSNGQAERAVQTVKTTLKKCIASGEDPELALLLLRTTPIDANLPSPAELMYGRPIQSILPNVPRKDPKQERIKNILRERQTRQKEYFDRRARAAGMSELKPGDLVMIQSPSDHIWKPGTIAQKLPEPRSYMVQTTDGARVRRNRQFIQLLKPRARTEFPSTTFANPPMKIETETPQGQETPGHYVTRSGREVKVPKRFEPD